MQGLSERGGLRRRTILALLVAAPAAIASQPAARSVNVSYLAELPEVPAGARRVRLWVPYPQSSRWQTVSDVRVSCSHPCRLGRNEVTGNAILSLFAEDALPPIKIELSFRVERREQAAAPNESEPASRLARWLEGDRLAPLDASVRQLAREVAAGRLGEREKTRAIYEHTLQTMRYDKTGTGWGQGDIHFACNFRRGNCTDFHALLIALCRAQGIPARLVVGLPLPRERGEGDIAGYHCWTEVYSGGWFPVDASEASKDPSRREYFFGTVDENRVALSVGRDIVLDPPQEGEPLNFFVFPYCEVDGQPFQGVNRKVRYSDIREIGPRPTDARSPAP